MKSRRPSTPIEDVLRALFYISLGMLAAAVAQLCAQSVKADEIELRPKTPAEIAAGWLPTRDARQVGDFWISYDGRARSARYVLEYFDPDQPQKYSRHSGFRSDPEAPPEARAVDEDYTNSGYDRGHLAASANHGTSDETNRATFVLSNAAPQHPALNRGAWKQLEALIREKTIRPAVIITAPLYIPDPKANRLVIDTIGDNHVWIPTHFGKAILSHDSKGNPIVAHWIIPNDDTRDNALNVYRVTGDEFEAALGIDIWHQLPDELETALEKERL